jgi:drug/metabolite transporter (DMT)-like permease
VTAVLGGLGAAVIWAVGTVFASRAARLLGPGLTLAWVMLIGLIALSLALPFSGSAQISLTTGLWLSLGGAGNVAGLLLLYRALRIGQLGVVMPIVSTEGGIAALISILAGQEVGLARGLALGVTVVGVILTARGRSAEPEPAAAALEPSVSPPGTGDRSAALWAVAGALSFGVSLFGTGRAGGVLPTTWAVMPPRVVGVLVVTLPLALRRQLRIPRAAVRLVLIAGVCEVAGFFSYAAGARHGIAVAAVLATLTGAIGAGFGRLLFGERLRAVQVLGVATIFVGVAAVSALG